MSFKIFITGGSGFIGRNLVEQLRNTYEVFAPSSNDLNLLDAKAVLNYLKTNKFDVVIHSATWNATRTSTKDVNIVLENNLRFFFNLMRGIEFFNKMIYYGSGAEFDRNHWIPKMSEDYFDTYVPSDQYGLSKYIINKYTEKSDRVYNLRLFGVFGKYEDWRIRFISQTCCRGLNGIPIKINQDVKFDYMYIDDVVKVTDWFINNNPKDRVYNVCSGAVLSLSDLAKKVLNISGQKLKILKVNEGMGLEYSGNNARLNKAMGFFPVSDIDENIKNLYEWYSQNPVDPNLIR